MTFIHLLGTAFDIEDGASLQMTVSGLKEETKAQGQIHESIAKDLEEKIAAPFQEWAEGYKVGSSYRSLFKDNYIDMCP